MVAHAGAAALINCVAAAFPPTQPEIAATERATDALEPAKEAALEAARNIADDVKQGAHSEPAEKLECPDNARADPGHDAHHDRPSCPASAVASSTASTSAAPMAEP